MSEVDSSNVVEARLSSQINEGPLSDFPEGFPFSRESYIRRLAEPAAFGMFPYIAGMTIMDDRIAAAVDMHSSFTEHPWGRLLGTVDSAIVLVFGNEQETTQTAKRLYEFHKTINGTEENVHYDANDIDSQTWVLASIFNGLKETKRRWAPPEFSTEQQEGLYKDIKTFGHFFGIDKSLQPQNVSELNDYWEDKLNNGRLLQTEISRRMAQTVFRFTSPKVPKSLARIGQAISIVSLDTRIQEQADLQPNEKDKQLASAFDITMKSTYAHIPTSMREQMIPAYMAVRRHTITALGKISSLQSQAL